MWPGNHICLRVAALLLQQQDKQTEITQEPAHITHSGSASTRRNKQPELLLGAAGCLQAGTGSMCL